MKRTWLAYGLAMCMLFSTVVSLPAIAESGEESAQDNAFLNWLSEGIQLLSEGAQEGLGELSQLVTDGWATLSDQFGAWKEAVENYFAESGWTDEVQKAWETLRAGAEQAGSVAQTEAEAAYRTIRAWLEQTGVTISEGYAAFIDYVAGNAGVVEAKAMNGYRVMLAWAEENQEQMTDDVKAALETLRAGCEDLGSVTEEEMQKACDEIQTWMESTGAEISQAVMDALESVKTAVQPETQTE